ncbi:hypothetical protein PIB30_056999 [Stylosanthes scabra]|uniref:Transposase-like protein n=1 Tax=Stylosanthes scabra TaxID=79078 RepID=A0ABU6WJE5_9FABA|nr:hypothetical protein [Stylosanthes scabra]
MVDELSELDESLLKLVLSLDEPCLGHAETWSKRGFACLLVSTWLEISFLTFKFECCPCNRAAARYTRVVVRLRKCDLHITPVCAAARYLVWAHISNVIELMLNEPWIMYSESPTGVKKHWFEKWAEKCTWPEAEKEEIRKAYDYRVGRHYQAVNKTRSLDRSPTEPELFRETHTWKLDGSIVEKRAENLLAQEEGDEFAGTVNPNVVWRQTLSEPYKNRVYGADGFFAGSLCTSGYGGSSATSASAASTQSGLATSEAKVVDLREQMHNLMQSLENQRQVLQQHIDEAWSLKDILGEKDARQIGASTTHGQDAAADVGLLQTPTPGEQHCG